MDIKRGQQLKESNSVCNNGYTAVLRDLKNGQNEATFHDYEYYGGEKPNCRVIYGFEITFGCAENSGNYQVILYFDGIRNSKDSFLALRGFNQRIISPKG